LQGKNYGTRKLGIKKENFKICRSGAKKGKKKKQDKRIPEEERKRKLREGATPKKNTAYIRKKKEHKESLAQKTTQKDSEKGKSGVCKKQSGKREAARTESTSIHKRELSRGGLHEMGGGHSPEKCKIFKGFPLERRLGKIGTENCRRKKKRTEVWVKSDAIKGSLKRSTPIAERGEGNK